MGFVFRRLRGAGGRGWIATSRGGGGLAARPCPPGVQEPSAPSTPSRHRMSKSAVVGALLRRLGACALILEARRRGWLRRDALTILGYHRIAGLPTDGFSGPDDNIS